jgi:hypothetical protein
LFLYRGSSTSFSFEYFLLIIYPFIEISTATFGISYPSKLVLRQYLQKASNATHSTNATNASLKILRFAVEEFAAVTFHAACDIFNSKSVAKST